MPIETVRYEKTFVLFESQFDSIARMSKAALICFSLASLSFSICFAMFTGWLFAEKLTPEVLFVTKVMAICFGFTTVIFVVFGLVFFVQNRGEVQELKKNTHAKPTGVETDSVAR